VIGDLSLSSLIDCDCGWKKLTTATSAITNNLLTSSCCGEIGKKRKNTTISLLLLLFGKKYIQRTIGWRQQQHPQQQSIGERARDRERQPARVDSSQPDLPRGNTSASHVDKKEEAIAIRGKHGQRAQ
jgi:hypothetical protein